MFFNRRRRYNGDVAAMLPAFGIDLDEVGPMKILGMLDVAYADKYSIYEAALTIAYWFAFGLYQTDVEKARVFQEDKLKPIQEDWVKKGIVRKQIFEPFIKKLEEISTKV